MKCGLVRCGRASATRSARPAGQIWARSAHEAGVGMNWVGAGNSVPSAAQLALIQSLEPTVLISMPSFTLHLANLAAEMAERIKMIFEMSARIDMLEIGTLARLFESSIKAPRFVDERK